MEHGQMDRTSEPQMNSSMVPECPEPQTNSVSFNSFIFTSADQDHQAVQLIATNLSEFSQLAIEHGFHLLIQCEVHGVETVRLTQSQPVCNMRKVISEMENLIENKRTAVDSKASDELIYERIKQDLNSITNTINTRFEEFSTRLSNLEPGRDQSLRRPLMLEEPKREMEPPEKRSRRRERRREEDVKPTHPSDKFFKQKRFELLKDSPGLMEKICHRLSEKREGDRSDPPFKDIDDLREKKKELVAFLDMFQTKADKKKTVPDKQREMMEWFNDNELQFLYRPSDHVKDVQRRSFKRQYKLEDTVGTNHFLRYEWDGRAVWHSFAIINNRIVDWNMDKVKGGAFQKLHTILSTNTMWPTDSKFATDFSNSHTDLFSSCHDQAIYEDNERVMTWMQENFKYLQYSTNNADICSIVCFHNLCMELVEKAWTWTL